MQKRTLHRVGAVCAILGVLVTGLAHAVHPDLPPDAGAFLKGVAESNGWIAIHWGLLMGLLLMQVGFTAAMLTLREQPSKQDAGGWGLLGLYALLVGLAAWCGVFTVEAALKPLADAVRSDAALLGGARALASLGDAGVSAGAIVYWAGIALLGTGMMVSPRYPAWLGGIGLVLGAAMSLGVGLPRAFLGASAWTERMGFPVLAIATLLWTVLLGGVLWRTAGARRR